MADLFGQLGEAGLNLNLGLGNLNKTMNVIVFFIIGGILIYLVWLYMEKRKYNIIIRGHDLRGNHDFEFNDKAREFIKFNRSELKLLKRKQANVIIPDLKAYRSMVDGSRVIHIFKYGAVNDYVVLDPEIVQDFERVPILDNEGKQLVDDKNEPIFIERPRYELKTTESMSKEHAVRDLRDAVNRFKTQTAMEKYSGVILIIVIGLVLIATAWIYGYYMKASSNNFLEAMQMGTDMMNKWLQYTQATGGGGIIPSG